MKGAMQMWDKISSFVSLASLLAVITLLFTAGSWKGDLEARVEHIDEVEAKVEKLEEWRGETDVINQQILTNQEWMLRSLEELKVEFKSQ